jgi:diaminohydroxyphosphoribosylaminopyrimidine deaminase / 5-amino-6-(5-phosphoribosylamino)uracil reductase
MVHDPAAAATPGADGADAWAFVRTLARDASSLASRGLPAAFRCEPDGTLTLVAPGDPRTAVSWQPGRGWVLPAVPGAETDEARTLADLYLPICSATAAAPIVLGHMGQSLDGFIATQSGDSRYVTGDENMRHMHRLRALCDAVVVGAGTVAADDPKLTTRHVPGPNPLRVVIDPMARLSSQFHVFQDGDAPTLYVYARRYVSGAAPAPGQADVLAVGDGPNGPDLAEVVAALRAKGCARIFVEGGGVTVSAFLAAGLLDRVQVAVAPMFIGGGRPAFRLPATNLLAECARPGYRVFRMGGDVLFDCDLRATVSAADAADTGGALLARVL